MHAPLILLNLYLAFGAWLRIQFNPNPCIIFRPLYPIIPLSQYITVNGPVSLLQALETKVIIALAGDVCCLQRGVLHSLGAVGGRTPFGLLAQVDVRLPEVVGVFLVVVWCAQGFKQFIGHDYLALLPGTGGVDGIGAGLDAVVQVLLEAVLTQEVTTVLHLGREFLLLVTDGAQEYARIHLWLALRRVKIQFLLHQVAAFR